MIFITLLKIPDLIFVLLCFQYTFVGKQKQKRVHKFRDMFFVYRENENYGTTSGVILYVIFSDTYCIVSFQRHLR